MAQQDLRRISDLVNRRQQLDREFRQAILSARRSGETFATIVPYAGLSIASLHRLVKQALEEEGDRVGPDDSDDGPTQPSG